MINNNIGELKLIDRSNLKEFQGKLKKEDNQEQIEKLSKEIKTQGFNSAIAVWDNNGDTSILDGHQRLKALDLLAEGGETLKDDKIPCIYIKADSEKKARQILLEYNTKYSHFDTLELREWSKDLELDYLEMEELEDIEPEIIEEDRSAIEDNIPDIPKNIIVEKGDIFQLGEHRLMCGDSTSIDDVEKLMDGEKADMVFTDPPYGVSASGGRSDLMKKKGVKKIENDELRGEELEGFIFIALNNISLKENGSFYICYDYRTQKEFCTAIDNTNYIRKTTIVWNKNNFGLSGLKGYRPKFELISFGYVGEKYEWYGDNSQADVWDIPRPTERHGNHPTPKPIELIEKAIKNSSAKGQSVIDIFGGSGTTLIASEKTNRKCYMMELDEKYIQVILKRYHDYTNGSKQIKCLNRELDLNEILF